MTKVSELREENLNQVRTCFSNISIWTKNELIAATGISSGGMVSILQELKERKEILQEEDAASTGGRPGHQYRLNPDAYHACCVFLKAGTEARMECFSMDLYGKRQQEKAYVISDTASVLSNIKQMLAADSSMKEILISVPGVSEEGKIRECDISFLSGCDLKQKIIAETGLVPVMENDVNIAAIGLQRKTQKTDLAYIYQPDTYIMAEKLKLTDAWFDGVRASLGALLKEHSGIVVFREITDAWLQEHLPAVPYRDLKWTSLLLQQMCIFYHDRIGARTIRSFGIYDYNNLHSFLVEDTGETRLLQDVLWDWLLLQGYGGKTLTIPELWELLVERKVMDPSVMESIGQFSGVLRDRRKYDWDMEKRAVTILEKAPDSED